MRRITFIFFYNSNTSPLWQLNPLKFSELHFREDWKQSYLKKVIAEHLKLYSFTEAVVIVLHQEGDESGVLVFDENGIRLI